MRTSTYLAVLVMAALVLLAACSSGGQARPATVRNYGPEASAPYVGSRAAPPAGPVAMAPTGGFYWHTRLADAQAEARATGKLILVMSTKPNCGLCEKFKTRIVPQAVHRVQPVAVGYVYDITRPEVAAVDRTLRGNLRGADLMPLVAFLTPDLRFVHGFWGVRTLAQFLGDIETAARIYPVSSASLQRVQAGPVLSAVVNEYGEPEWSPPGDVWPEGEPEPIDAIPGAPTLAQAPEPVQPPAAPVRTAAPEPVVVAPAAVPAPPPPPAAVVVTEPAPYVGIQAPIIEPPVESPPEPEAPVASWGDQALQSALADIRGGRFGSARSTLDRVQQELPDTAQAREAVRGCVALYNAKRIRNATSNSERSRYLARARRDLGSSMWGTLFGS